MEDYESKSETNRAQIEKLNDNEGVKVPVVAVSHAVVDPWAMVVEFVDAAVTLEAMPRPWRPEKLALEAEGGGIVHFQQLQEVLIFLRSYVTWVLFAQQVVKKQAKRKEAV